MSIEELKIECLIDVRDGDYVSARKRDPRSHASMTLPGTLVEGYAQVDVDGVVTLGREVLCEEDDDENPTRTVFLAGITEVVFPLPLPKRTASIIALHKYGEEKFRTPRTAMLGHDGYWRLRTNGEVLDMTRDIEWSETYVQVVQDVHFTEGDPEDEF